MGDSESEKVGRDGGSFDMVGGGETDDEVVEVSEGVIFNTKIVDDEGKMNRASMVGEEAGLKLVGFLVAAGAEYVEYLFVGVKTCLAEARYGLHDRDIKKFLAGAVKLEEGGDAEFGEEKRGEEEGIDSHIFGGGHV